jgi:AI-2 transport protein TqsA
MIIVAFLLSIAALRFAFAITMPMTFAAIIIAALWPMSRWLGRFMPSPAAYLLKILALIGVLGAFVAAVYLSVGQVTGVMGTQWRGIEQSYANIARFAGAHGVPLTGAIDRGRTVSMVQTLAGGVYSFITYVGFIGLLVMLGLPEVPRLKVKLGSLLDSDSRREMITSAQESRCAAIFRTTMATSILTGVVSALWSWMTGLELALVWGCSISSSTLFPRLAISSVSFRLSSMLSFNSAAQKCRSWC